jgi:hypothetical protein
MSNERYIVVVNHGERFTTYNVVDTWQPQSEQPAVVHCWATDFEPNAAFLAKDFCVRNNGKHLA